MGNFQNTSTFTVQIKDAVPQHNKDASALVSVVLNFFGIQLDLEGIDKDIAEIGLSNTPSRPSFVAMLDFSIVGVATMNLEDPDKAFISGLYVSPDQQRCGIGRALLNHMIAFARTQNVTILRLETRARFEGAVKLYESTGWVRGADMARDNGPERQYFLNLD